MGLKEKLAVFCRQQGLTQDELALKICVSRQTISKWERGAAVPSTESLVALGRLYGIPLDELANGELSPQEEPAAVAVAEGPEAPPPPESRRLKIAVGAVLAACLPAADDCRGRYHDLVCCVSGAGGDGRRNYLDR